VEERGLKPGEVRAGHNGHNGHGEVDILAKLPKDTPVAEMFFDTMMSRLASLKAENAGLKVDAAAMRERITELEKQIEESGDGKEEKRRGDLAEVLTDPS
jgi:regulator of replication initiation timing